MLKFYNTKTRRKEDFIPIRNNVVKIYSCGPTVYSTQHLGNLRAAIFVDLLKRTLMYFNYKVVSVMNITDVGHLVSDENEGEDKILKASRLEKKDPIEIAKFYTNKYLEDLKKINVLPPNYMPKATEHIKEQIEIIKELEEKGYTYKTNDGVYFDVSKFKGYGLLSGQKLEDKKKGARVKLNVEKKNPQDFALWKFIVGENKNHIMRWESPWGIGFPGWHIECSAMSHKYLGSEFDIHTGGIEHIPVHHENEIAQNTCSGVINRVNFWMHNAHMVVNSKKMSKSLGNVVYLDDLIKEDINPLAFRLFCLQTHYRQQLNFTKGAILSAQISLEKINECYNRIKSLNECEESEREEKINKEIEKRLDEFEDALKEDLNSPRALAAVFEFINFVNKFRELSRNEKEKILNFFNRVDKVLALLEFCEIPKKVLDLAEKRKKAREEKNFILADKIREEIKMCGFDIKDSKIAKKGYIISKSN